MNYKNIISVLLIIFALTVTFNVELFVNYNVDYETLNANLKFQRWTNNLMNYAFYKGIVEPMPIETENYERDYEMANNIFNLMFNWTNTEGYMENRSKIIESDDSDAINNLVQIYMPDINEIDYNIEKQSLKLETVDVIGAYYYNGVYNYTTELKLSKKDNDNYSIIYVVADYETDVNGNLLNIEIDNIAEY